ncbi:aminodeoxychorismate/anthranilate synthase component II [Bacillus sp. T3]|uniref:anthranilate synthase component II n=1 Tax=Bacillus sp. T3 TaxID=467262 RepID=UPI0029816AD0|nr:aminodeoxychorismate/anthranilate synthase component II [Bacillus sp. T3]
MILLIDNYDSFTYNLYQYFGELGEEITVIRNDQLTINDIKKLNPEAIILSPGPGRPENAGICVDVIKAFQGSIPILGICLGHQAIGYAFGATIDRADNIMHGKTSQVEHNRSDLFAGLPQHLEVMRYHSLVINKQTVPEELVVLGTTTCDEQIMAVKHKQFPIYGLQFHPESVGTIHGKQMLANFLAEIRKESNYEVIS